MKHYATPKTFHDPAKARERGRQDVKREPPTEFHCDHCRIQYYLGRLEAMAQGLGMWWEK